MPIYEYRCNKCNCEFEHLKLTGGEPDPQCPSCCTDKVDRMLSAGAIRPAGIPSGKGGFTPPKCKSSGG